MEKSVVKKVSIREAQSDFAFWKTQPYEKRLEALEEIRREYVIWKYGHEPGFQRVSSVVKRK